MKERIYKHVGTTIIGVIIWIVTIGLFVINKLELLPNAHEMSITEVVAFMMLGYIFFVGKTSLLNGLSLGIFKKLGWIKDD
jgi:hypothetical protein